MPPSINLVGHRYSRWTVLSKDTSRDKNTRYLCRCDCGKVKSVFAGTLRAGVTKSCGCLHKEILRKRQTKHGRSGSRMYSLWNAMKDRCRNPNNTFYSVYGGKGINVCDRWLSFENFLADMGEKPDGMSLDRIDNSKGYEPSNCRWASAQQQASNTSKNRFITYNGVTKTLAQWARESGIKYGTLKARAIKMERCQIDFLAPARKKL